MAIDLTRAKSATRRMLLAQRCDLIIAYIKSLRTKLVSGAPGEVILPDFLKPRSN